MKTIKQKKKKTEEDEVLQAEEGFEKEYEREQTGE